MRGSDSEPAGWFADSAEFVARVTELRADSVFRLTYDRLINCDWRHNYFRDT